MARVDAARRLCMSVPFGNVLGAITVVCWSSDPHCRLPRSGIGRSTRTPLLGPHVGVVASVRYCGLKTRGMPLRSLVP